MKSRRSAVACLGLALALAPMVTACARSSGATITENMARNLFQGSSRGLSAWMAARAAAAHQNSGAGVGGTGEPGKKETPRVEETGQAEDAEVREPEESKGPEDEVGDDQDQVEDDEGEADEVKEDHQDEDKGERDDEDDDEGEEESRLLPGYRLCFAPAPVIA